MEIVDQVEELYARHDLELHSIFSRMLSELPVESTSVVLQEDNNAS